MRLRGRAIATAAAAIGSAAVASVTSAWRLRPRVYPQPLPWRPRLSPGPARRVGVVFNPTKEAAQIGCTVVSRELERVGWPEARYYETAAEDPGTGMAHKALEDGCEIVIAAGGDGTVRSVAEALSGTTAALGILPLGTGNLLARNLELPLSDLVSCVDIALHGAVRRIDMVGLRVNFEGGRTSEMNYLVMGGAGFDAQIMTDAKEELKSRWGWLAYFEAGLRNLVSPRSSVTLRIDGGPPLKRRIQSVLIANCGEITAGIHLASDSRADDGQLEVILLTPRNLLGWGALAVQVLTRHRRGLPVLEHLHGTSVEIDFGSSPQPVELDGDLLGTALDLSARVRPAVLNVHTYPERTPTLLRNWLGLSAG
jgi:diacylglycerol kinase (ATP)